jgi:hypothetical protein
MGLGFRPRLEGAHDFMHFYYGGFGPYSIKDFQYFAWADELDLPVVYG